MPSNAARRGLKTRNIATKNAANDASQKPPGIVTVVLPYPPPRSAGMGCVADDQPQDPPATRNTNSTKVFNAVPATYGLDVLAGGDEVFARDLLAQRRIARMHRAIPHHALARCPQCCGSYRMALHSASRTRRSLHPRRGHGIQQGRERRRPRLPQLHRRLARALIASSIRVCSTPLFATVRRRDVTEGVNVGRSSGSLRRILVPLALAQFICSFAGSNMNVMINDISEDLDTTVQGVQTAITIFLLVMAALMIPAGKLTDRWGRKRCFTARPHRVRDRRVVERSRLRVSAC